MAGWIKLHRKLKNSLVFDNPDLLKVWIWCLLKATHDDYIQMIGLQEVELEKGQFIFGRKVAANELKMSESKTYRLIKKLETMQNLNIKANNKYSIITIANWELYQSDSNNSEQQFEQQMNNKRTTNEQQMNTNKNIKNNKNINKDIPLKKEPKIFTSEDKEYLLAEYLSKQIAKRLNKPLKEEKDLQRWAADFNKMVRLDNYDIEEIKQVLMFSQKNDFWQTNILSAAKFRKQYLTLLSQMKRDEGKGKPDTGKKTNKFHNFIQNNEYTGDDLEAIARKRFEEKIKKLGIATEEEK